MGITTHHRPVVELEFVDGNLLKQDDVEVWVSACGLNITPSWLKIKSGISGKLEEVTGPEPWLTLRQGGYLKPGTVRLTPGGNIEQHIAHVTPRNLAAVVTPTSVTTAVQNTVQMVWDEGFQSVAFPLIGAGDDGLPRAEIKQIMADALAEWVVTKDTPEHYRRILVRIVDWR